MTVIEMKVQVCEFDLQIVWKCVGAKPIYFQFYLILNVAEAFWSVSNRITIPIKLVIIRIWYLAW
jgi:hypothetical protein